MWTRHSCTHWIWPVRESRHLVDDLLFAGDVCVDWCNHCKPYSKFVAFPLLPLSFEDGYSLPSNSSIYSNVFLDDAYDTFETIVWSCHSWKRPPILPVFRSFSGFKSYCSNSCLLEMSLSCAAIAPWGVNYCVWSNTVVTGASDTRSHATSCVVFSSTVSYDLKVAVLRY